MKRTWESTHNLSALVAGPQSSERKKNTIGGLDWGKQLLCPSRKGMGEESSLSSPLHWLQYTEALQSTPQLIALNSSQVLFRLKQPTFIFIF